MWKCVGYQYFGAGLRTVYAEARQAELRSEFKCHFEDANPEEKWTAFYEELFATNCCQDFNLELIEFLLPKSKFAAALCCTRISSSQFSTAARITAIMTSFFPNNEEKLVDLASLSLVSALVADNGIGFETFEHLPEGIVFCLYY